MHVFYLRLKTTVLGHRVLQAAAGRFGVVELSVWRVDNAITVLPETEAKIDIIESDLEMRFVEAPGLEIGASPNEHTRRGHGGKFLGKNGARKIAMIGPRQTLVRVRRHSPAPKDDPGMLNMVVRIKQTRADCADARLQRLAYHLVQPIRIDDRQVVIQQGDEFRLDLARPRNY